MPAAFSAIDAARLRRVPRIPFVVAGRTVGSVAAACLPALTGWTQWLNLSADAVTLTAPPEARDQALAEMNRALRGAGQVLAWRDEPFVLPDPDTGEVLATMERAAARFWGTLTFGAHATGYLADADGRPTHLWIAQRSFAKATDPGLFDNLIGGGVPVGQTPAEALLREGFEEAGLAPHEVAPAHPASVLELARDIPEGFQHEWLYGFDLRLPPGREPHNQDGEVAGFACLTVAEAIALAAGPGMTVDAAVVTIDFLCRHGLLVGHMATERASGVAGLRLAHPPLGHGDLPLQPTRSSAASPTR